MTREEFFEMFDLVVSTKTSVAIGCIRDAKTIKDAEWHALDATAELQGVYRGYTDAGEAFNVCKSLDEEFFKRMWYYRNFIDEELAKYKATHRRKRK